MERLCATMTLRQVFVWLARVVFAASALVATVACSPTAAPSPPPASENVGYDVSKDPAVSGQYLSSGAYVDGQGVNPEEVKWRTLLHGLEAARKDGYDLVVWSEPAAASMTETKVYLSQRIGSYQKYGRYLAFTCLVRGYKSNGNRPANARPVGAVIDRINGELAKRKLTA